MRLFRPNINDLDHPYVRVTSYISITLAVLGIVGNILSIKVMKHRELKEFSCTVFYAALAISDTIVLIFEVMDDIAYHLEDYTGYDLLYGGSQWRCRFGVFIYECSRVISSWLIVALSAELCLVAYNPSSRSAVYSGDRALYVALAIFLIASAGCFPFLVISSDLEEDGRCTSKYKTFYEVYQMFVLRIAAQAVVPFVFLTACSLKAMYSLNRQAQQDYENSQHYGNQGPDTPKPKYQAKTLIFMSSAIFILSISPSTIVDTGMALERYFTTVHLYYPKWDPAWYITHTLLLVNYSCKFYLVIVTWPDSRSAIGGKGLGLGSHKTTSGAYTEEIKDSYQMNSVSNHRMPSIYEYSEQRHSFTTF